jgi:hypothetical protein
MRPRAEARIPLPSTRPGSMTTSCITGTSLDRAMLVAPRRAQRPARREPRRLCRRRGAASDRDLGGKRLVPARRPRPPQGRSQRLGSSFTRASTWRSRGQHTSHVRSSCGCSSCIVPRELRLRESEHKSSATTNLLGIHFARLESLLRVGLDRRWLRCRNRAACLGHSSASITLNVYGHLWRPKAGHRTRAAAANLMASTAVPADSVRTRTGS